jgi:glutathione S-transferase
MVMPPMNTVVVHTLILPEDRRDPEVLRQAKSLLSKSIVPIDELLSKNKFLIGEKISGVDFMLGHSLYMANKLACVSEELANIHRYIQLLNSLESFQIAINT